ncbi:MAG: putative uroporphyrinogen synthase [Actinomycetota bacterium]|jgi:uroporphyrinogen-III synthase
MSGALAGRKVVITRAAEQADALAELLGAAGAVPVTVPLVAIEPVPAEVERLASLQPAEFDWLVVTSPNGARAFMAAHHSAPAQVAAVGTATAAVLTEHGVAVSLVPTQQNAEGLLAEFPADAAGSVLLVQAEAAETTVAQGLRDRRLQVTAVAPYRTVPVRPSAALQLAALSADAVLFASGSAARAWQAVFGTSAPALVVSIGPRTTAAIEALGLKVNLEAADHSLSGLVDVLVNHLRNVT